MEDRNGEKITTKSLLKDEYDMTEEILYKVRYGKKKPRNEAITITQVMEEPCDTDYEFLEIV